MGILKEGFSAYSSPVMLISRKLTKDNDMIWYDMINLLKHSFLLSLQHSMALYNNSVHTIKPIYMYKSYLLKLSKLFVKTD